MTEPTDAHQRGMAADRTLLWETLNAPEPTSSLGKLSRMSLLGEMRRSGDFDDVFEQYSLPERAELDLHLREQGEDEQDRHETDAAPLGKFVTRTATVVKEVAKSERQVERMASTLQIVGGFTEGSVRVLFRAAELDRVSQKRATQTTDFDTPDLGNTAEALAMQSLAALLVQALEDIEEDVDGSALTASVHRLRPPARNAIRLFGRSIADARWTVDGELRKRGWKTTPVRVTPASARRLEIAAGQDEERTDTVTITGNVSGWEWSDLVMRIRPDASKRRIPVAVLDRAKQELVTEILKDEDNRVRVELLEVTATQTQGEVVRTRTSYSLLNIELIDQDAAAETYALFSPGSDRSKDVPQA